MSAVADSRKQIPSRKLVLDQIRAATQNSATDAATAAQSYAALERNYVRQGKMTVRACQERFVERLREYDAEVVECEPVGLVAAIAEQLAASGKHTFVAPPGLPADWLIPGFNWKIDHALAVQEVEQAEGVLTACFCGVAESGTIVLHHSDIEGRRVISLLPDWHLCIVRASQVVETLPEYFDRCGAKTQGLAAEQQSAQPPALVTWISGPSATADIEMTRIKGVHGPRFLRVILVRDSE